MFYVDELHDTSTVGNYNQVAVKLRECMQSDLPPDIFIREFMHQLRQCQTSRTRKSRNGRFRAIVYNWNMLDEHLVQIVYGMCTFTDRTGRENFRKSELRTTAHRRFVNHQHTITENVTEGPMTKKRVESIINHHIQSRIRKSTGSQRL